MRDGKERDLSEYRGMWLFAMFDLPVDTAAARKEYTRFRKALLREGFMMLQFSIYARYFACEEASESHRKRVRAIIPPAGQVRLMSVTDRQFGKMEVFQGKKKETAEKPPEQLLLF